MDFLYRHPIESFDGLTTFPKALRQKLSEVIVLSPLRLSTTLESPDKTVKHAYEVGGPKGAKALLESVWMPSDPTDLGASGKKAGAKPGQEEKGEGARQRHTLCVSTQLGCAAGCVLCATGMLGLKGQLTAGEIVYQVVDCLKLYGAYPDVVVLMGMGEPMHNFEAVSAAVEIVTHPDALGFSPRRVVVSTVGEIDRLAAFHRKFPRVGLAISLNASTDDLRSSLMPINKKFNLRAIADFILSLTLAHGDLVTLEYVVLAGVNDTPRQVQALAGYLKPLARRVKLNLIAFNPVEGLEFRSPSRDSMLRIQEAVKSVGVMAFIRRSRGRGIGAACGQLAGRI